MKFIRQPLTKNCRLNVMKLPLITLIVFLSIEVFSQCKPEALNSPTCSGSRISFRGNALGYTNTSVLWEFGDSISSTSNQVDPKFMYKKAGMYTVTFTGIGNLGTCKDTFSVVVLQGPEINFSQILPKEQCFRNNQFIFLDSSKSSVFKTLVRRTVVAEEGFFHESITPKQNDSIKLKTIDPRGGTFDVTVEVEDSNGCIAKKILPDELVIWPRIGAYFKIDETQSIFGCDSIRLVIENDTTFGESKIKHFEWDWGNGDKTWGTLDSNVELWRGKNKDYIIQKDYSGQGNYPVKLVVENEKGCRDSFISNEISTKHTIAGNIYLDQNENCTFDKNEILLRNDQFGAFNFNSKFSEFKDGQYTLKLDNSVTYEAKFSVFNSKNPFINICNPPFTIRLDSSAECNIAGPDIGVQFKKCAELSVAIYDSRFRRCNTGKTELRIKNEGLQTAKDVAVEVTLPWFFNIENYSYSGGTSIKMDNTGNHRFVFRIDSLKGLETESIFIERTIPCTEEARNQNGCVTAKISATNDCENDYLSIESKIQMVSDGVADLSFKNRSSEDTDLSFNLFESDQHVLQDKISLGTGDSTVYRFYPQPGSSFFATLQPTSNYVVNQSFSTNGSNSFFGEKDSVYQWLPNHKKPTELCGTVRDSYDPNDKQVSPSELDIDKDIPFGRLLTYTIRFQNTGNDTAYKVVVEDLLHRHFDINTLDIVHSTHSFGYKIEAKDYGQHLVSFVFDDIYLVDSTTNEEGSQGAITFKIALKKNQMSRATSIYNKAGIFFDFNPPIYTNSSELKIGKDIKEFEPVDFNKDGKTLQQVINIDTIVCDTFFSPVDKSKFYVGRLNRSDVYLEHDTSVHSYKKYYRLNLTIPNLKLSVSQDGELIDASKSWSRFPMHNTWLNCDSGYSIIPNESADTFRATKNGSYAVEISSLTCFDTSICFDVTTIIEDSIPDDSLINIYNVELKTFTVYPNPNNGKFQIVMQNDRSSNLRFEHISLFDVNGKEIPIARNEETITVGEDVKTGMYFLKMIDHKRVYSKRISIIK